MPDSVTSCVGWNSGGVTRVMSSFETDIHCTFHPSGALLKYGNSSLPKIMNTVCLIVRIYTLILRHAGAQPLPLLADAGSDLLNVGIYLTDWEAARLACHQCQPNQTGVRTVRLLVLRFFLLIVSFALAHFTVLGFVSPGRLLLQRLGVGCLATIRIATTPLLAFSWSGGLRTTLLRRFRDEIRPRLFSLCMLVPRRCSFSRG